MSMFILVACGWGGRRHFSLLYCIYIFYTVYRAASHHALNFAGADPESIAMRRDEFMGRRKQRGCIVYTYIYIARAARAS